MRSHEQPGAAPRKKPRETSPPAGPAASARLTRALGNAQRARREDDIAGQYVDDDIQGRIDAKRGTGSSLPSDVNDRLGSALNDDFSDVRTHTDGAADTLSRELNAEAFTVGRDVFFSAGAFTPGTEAGERLLGHELTHVQQQRGSNTSGPLRVTDPSEPSERHAAGVGETVAASRSVAREGLEEEEELQMAPAIAREGLEEEEELQMAPAIAREGLEEEEELQMAPAIAREGLEEEEELQMAPAIAREGPEEEEELQMAPAIAREGLEEEEELQMAPAIARGTSSPRSRVATDEV